MESFYLQSTDFITQVRSVLGGSPSEFIGSIAPYIVFGIIIAAALVVGFVVYRAIMTFRAFGHGEPLGRFRIVNIGTREIMTGYLAKSDAFNMRDDLEEMEEEEDLKPLADHIMKNVDDEKLFVYEYNIFDWENTVRGKVKHVRIICDKKLEDNSWIDQTGSRSWRSILNKDYIKTVIGYQNSRYLEIKNPDSNLDGYYALAVMPLVNVGKKGIVMSSLVNPSTEQIVIAPTIPQNSKEIMKAASFLEIIAEGHRRMRDSKLHESKLQEMLSKEQRANMTLKMMVNKLRRILQQHLLIGFAKQQTPLQRISTMTWMIGGCIATLFGALVVPNMDGIKETNIPNWLVGGAAMFTVIIVRYLMESRQEPINKSDIEEIPENAEKID